MLHSYVYLKSGLVWFLIVCWYDSSDRTDEQDAEERKIREEIRSIDSTLKKMKKTVRGGEGGWCCEYIYMYSSIYINTERCCDDTLVVCVVTVQNKQNTSSSAASSASSSHPPPRGSGPSLAPPPVQPDSAAAALNPPIMMYGGGLVDPTGTGLHPGPGRPCLQSARLALHSEHNQPLHNPELSRSFMKKIVLLLQEQGMPDRLLPTRTVCDMNDQVMYSSLRPTDRHRYRDC